MKKILLTLGLFVLLFFIGFLLYFQFSDCGISPLSCGDYSTKSNPTTQKIMLGSGPEDMAIDTSLGYPRIIVSCTERRKDQSRIGGFYGIDPETNTSIPFKISPTDFEVYPHGIDVVTIDSIPYLYAISHHNDAGVWRHPVVRFEIKGNTLIADQNHILEHSLMNVPNDLDVLEDGSFYASNYVPNMDLMESTKAILGVKNGSIVYYDGEGNWEIVLKDMCYPNGIYVDQISNHILIANGGCQEVVRYPLEGDQLNITQKHSTKTNDINIPIGDNLMLDNQGVLWTAAHPCPLKFLDHAGNSAIKSPMQIFAIDPNTMKSNLVFQNNGDLISAASTVLRLNDKIYVSQVFDPFVLVIDGLAL